jgi:hypothetical protein
MVFMVWPLPYVHNRAHQKVDVDSLFSLCFIKHICLLMCFSGTIKRSNQKQQAPFTLQYLTTGWTYPRFFFRKIRAAPSEMASETHSFHAQQQLFHQPPASTEVWGQSHGYPCCKWPSCGLPRRRVSSWRWLEDRPGAGRQGVRSMPSPPFFQCGKQWRGPFPE